jgi:D-serine dehydratase
MTEIFMLARRQGAFDQGSLEVPQEAIITAGGSTFFDIVAQRLTAMRDPGPTRVVIRSGCYLTHDSGQYEGEFPALARRLPPDLASSLGAMHPALFVWSCVQSRPEAGLALLTMGKRDASYDAGLPVPLLHGRIGESRTTPLDRNWRIDRMNDQHAYLHLPDGADVAIGDLICCGISHPCTTFDKWREIHIVEDDWTVAETIQTFF